MKINWKAKLTSRKFWAAIIGFATAIISAFKIESITAEQVTLIITAISTLVAYIIGEGFTDASAAKGTQNDTVQNTEPDSLFDEKS